MVISGRMSLSLVTTLVLAAARLLFVCVVAFTECQRKPYTDNAAAVGSAIVH